MALIIRHERIGEEEWYVDQVRGAIGVFERWELHVSEFKPEMILGGGVPVVVAPSEREVAHLILFPGAALSNLRRAFVDDVIDLEIFEACVAHVLDRIYGDAWAEM